MKKLLILALVGTFAFSCPATTKKCDTNGKCNSGMMKNEKCKMKFEKNCTIKMDMKNGIKCQAGKCGSGK
jgi:hypothetical protein